MDDPLTPDPTGPATPWWRHVPGPLGMLLVLAALNYAWVGQLDMPADTGPAQPPVAELPPDQLGLWLALFAPLCLAALPLLARVYTRVLPAERPVAPPWGAGAGLMLFFAALCAQLGLSIALYLAYGALEGHKPGPPGPDHPGPGMIVMIVSELALIGILLGLIGGVRPGGPESVGLRAARPLRQLSGVGLSLVLFVPFYLLLVVLCYVLFRAHGRPPQPQSVVQQAMELRGTAWFWVVVTFAVVVAPLFEELLYRGLLFPALRQVMPVSYAAALSGAVFSLSHLEPLAVLPLFGLGTLLATVFHRTGSLLAPFAAHALFNGFMLSLMVFASGP